MEGENQTIRYSVVVEGGQDAHESILNAVREIEGAHVDGAETEVEEE